ncbi:MAG: radical SAM protein [Phycisphaerales bacterium]|nr:radical SAM protein [Phycisphaerales bacterium]
MSTAQLEQYSMANTQIAQLLAGRNEKQADRLARHQLSEALCDWAGTLLIRKDLDRAVLTLQDALNACPENRRAFHNLVGTLLGRRQLRGDAFLGILRFMANNSFDWLREYRELSLLPHFVNLEVIRGKCNLKCRMCLGTNSPNHPNKLDYMTAEQFRDMLAAAPTTKGVTLSSGDSDPLLHPQFAQIIDVAREFGILLDMFTNGQPLSPRSARQMVESGVMQMINFSIDAATQETYARIRGDDLARLRSKIDMLTVLKREMGKSSPWLSFSFVAMRDNIHELPDFVSMARSHGALRVFVEDLIGWDAETSGNVVATDHPEWREFVFESRKRAAEAKITLTLPERFVAGLNAPHNSPATTAPYRDNSCEKPSNCGSKLKAGTAAAQSQPAETGGAVMEKTGSLSESVAADAAEPKSAQPVRLPACSWLNGVMVGRTGRIDPCCLLQNVADMGNVSDGPLHLNTKYVRVKKLLSEGKVFDGCENQRMCAYVQQQHAAGIPLRVITREELGDLYIAPAVTACAADVAPHQNSVSLPVATAK